MDYIKIAIPFAIALILTAIATPAFISFMERRNGGQCIREEGPASIKKVRNADYGRIGTDRSGDCDLFSDK